MRKGFCSEIRNAINGPPRKSVTKTELRNIKTDKQAVQELGRKWKNIISGDKHAKMLADVYELEKSGVLGHKSLEFSIEKLLEKNRIRQIRKLLSTVNENIITLPILNTYIKAESFSRGDDDVHFETAVKQLHRLGYQPNIQTYNSILQYHSNRGDREKVDQVISIINSNCVAKTENTYTHMIRVMEPNWKNFEETLQDMADCYVFATQPTLHALVESCSKDYDFLLQHQESVVNDLLSLVRQFTTKDTTLQLSEDSNIVLMRAFSSFEMSFSAFDLYDKTASDIPSTALTLTYLHMCQSIQSSKHIEKSKKIQYVDNATNKFIKQLNIGTKSPLLWMAMYNVYEAAGDVQQLVELLSRCSKYDTRGSKDNPSHGTLFKKLQNKHVEYLKRVEELNNNN